MHLLSYKINLYYILSVYPTTKMLKIGQSIMVQAGRKEDALKKYPELSKDIDYFIQRDPSGNLKYLDWELKILHSKQALAPEIADVVDLFDKYSANLKHKDINAYKNFTELREALFYIKEKRDEKGEKQEKRYHLEEACDSQTVYEDSKFVVRLIKNKAASIHYGLGTK